MIKCKHCEAEFEDWEISEFTVHLDEAHEVEFPICLGNHGICTMPVAPMNWVDDIWEYWIGQNVSREEPDWL